MTLLDRRRMMVQAADSGPIWLYNEGETSPIIGGWNTTGYKYGADEHFAQSIQPTYLQIGPTTTVNYHGGRTFTSDNRLPASLIGKTLHVVGTMALTAGTGGRNTNVYVAISDDVVDDSSVEAPLSSASFVRPRITKSFAFGSGTTNYPAGTTKDFELVLPITQDGYLSVFFFKGYNGNYTNKFTKIWVE